MLNKLKVQREHFFLSKLSGINGILRENEESLVSCINALNRSVVLLHLECILLSLQTYHLKFIMNKKPK